MFAKVDVTDGDVVYGSIYINLRYRGEYKFEGSCQQQEWQLQEWICEICITLEAGTNYAGKPRSAHIELAFDRGLVA